VNFSFQHLFLIRYLSNLFLDVVHVSREFSNFVLIVDCLILSWEDSFLVYIAEAMVEVLLYVFEQAF